MYSKQVIKLQLFIFYFWFVICNNFQKKIVNIFILSKYKSDLRKRQAKNEVVKIDLFFIEYILLIKFH